MNLKQKKSNNRKALCRSHDNDTYLYIYKCIFVWFLFKINDYFARISWYFVLVSSNKYKFTVMHSQSEKQRANTSDINKYSITIITGEPKNIYGEHRSKD